MNWQEYLEENTINVRWDNDSIEKDIYLRLEDAKAACEMAYKEGNDKMIMDVSQRLSQVAAEAYNEGYENALDTILLKAKEQGIQEAWLLEVIINKLKED